MARILMEYGAFSRRRQIYGTEPRADNLIECSAMRCLLPTLIVTCLWGPRLSAQLLEGPAVGADRKITFRLKAPDAKSVLLDPLGGDLSPEKGPFPLERGPDGTWTA